MVCVILVLDMAYNVIFPTSDLNNPLRQSERDILNNHLTLYPSETFFKRYQHFVDKYSVNYVQMTTDGIDIRFWFKVDD